MKSFFVPKTCELMADFLWDFHALTRGITFKVLSELKSLILRRFHSKIKVSRFILIVSSSEMKALKESLSQVSIPPLAS